MNEATFQQFMSDMQLVADKYDYTVNPPMNFTPQPLDVIGDVVNHVYLSLEHK